MFHPRWTFRAFWWLWRVAFAVALALHPLVPPVVWPVLLGAFVVVEGWGLARSGKNDTLSETHWTQGRMEWSMRLWSTGSALAYGWALARLPDWWLGVEPSVGWYLICAGIVGWLVGHFWRFKHDEEWTFGDEEG